VTAQDCSLRFVAALVVLQAALLAGCPSEASKTREPPAICTKAGDPCTVSPGKLGLCVEPGDGRTSLACQSLH
jgi:hypothetical protein